MLGRREDSCDHGTRSPGVKTPARYELSWKVRMQIKNVKWTYSRAVQLLVREIEAVKT